jgi:hypothetical protein
VGTLHSPIQEQSQDEEPLGAIVRRDRGKEAGEEERKKVEENKEAQQRLNKEWSMKQEVKQVATEVMKQVMVVGCSSRNDRKGRRRGQRPASQRTRASRGGGVKGRKEKKKGK